MLEEIEYWNASSWKEFVKNNLVPLRDLGIHLGDELDPLFYMDLPEKVFDIDYLAQEAVEIAEKIFREPMGKRKIPEEEDLLEILREFLEIGANTTAGCSKHTFFVWSTRKITKNYLEEHYPLLKDPKMFKKVAKILGWVEYGDSQTQSSSKVIRYTLTLITMPFSRYKKRIPENFAFGFQKMQNTRWVD